MYGLRRLFNSEIFQGKYKKRNYFEGWYYKLIDPTMEHAIAIIPGISLGKNRKDCHAFFQVLYNGKQVSYYRFDLRAFRYHKKRFAIRIGQNYFSESRLYLRMCHPNAEHSKHIKQSKDMKQSSDWIQSNTMKQRNDQQPGDDNIELSCNLIFKDIIRLPKSLYLPGIMGPYTYIPFMECYHGIINIHHNITGNLKIGDKQIDFTGGYGYIEKDWGRSFPKTWVWLQSNHFGNRDASIMLSAARIPWLGSSFPGFISFLRIREKLYLFATYTGAKLIRLDYEQGILRALIMDRSYRLELSVTQTQGGELKAPSMGRMERTIIESISSVVQIRFCRRSGELLFEGTGTNAGLEIVD